MVAVHADTHRCWQAAAESLVALSDEWDDVRIDRTAARRILRCDEATLELLCEHGLPTRVEDGVQSFGECDVMNLGLAAGGGRSVPELALRQLLRFASLGRAEWLRPREWAVTITAECACRERAGELHWALATPVPEVYGGATHAFEVDRVRPATLALALRVRTRGCDAGELRAAARGAMAEVLADVDAGRLRFCYLPATLRAMPREALAAGLIDCVALSLHMAERLAAEGLPARTRQGHLLSGVGVEHAWIELEEPGGGAAFDPMLAVLGHQAPHVADGFVEFCARALSNRVLPWDSHAGEELIRHAPAAGDRREHRLAVKLSARAGRES